MEGWRAQGHHRHDGRPNELLVRSRSQAKTGRPFKYHDSQREAIETLIYVWEVEKVRTRKDLLERYAQNAPDLRLARMTNSPVIAPRWPGSGKTKVMSLAIAWQYFNAMREQDKLPKTTPRLSCSLLRTSSCWSG